MSLFCFNTKQLLINVESVFCSISMVLYKEFQSNISQFNVLKLAKLIFLCVTQFCCRMENIEKRLKRN